MFPVNGPLGPWSVCACLRSSLMQLLHGAAGSRSGLGFGFGFREILCKLSSKSNNIVRCLYNSFHNEGLPHISSQALSYSKHAAGD